MIQETRMLIILTSCYSTTFNWTLVMKNITIEYRIALAASVIGCSLGSVLWMNGDAYMGTGYLYGDGIYKLGYPATEIAWSITERNGFLKKNDDLWAIPLMNVSFTIQMFAWATLAFWIKRLVQIKGNNN